MGMERVFNLLRATLPRLGGATDRDLLDRFLASRDEVAFAELVRRHGPLVWGVCRRRLDLPDAEDAFQATFLVLLRRAGRLEPAIPLGPWLHRVAVMTVRNAARGNRRRRAVAIPLEPEVVAPVGLAVEDRLDLDAALMTLPARDRTAVILCHLQGFSRREAAAKLGCPEGTLSARLSRALTRLRRLAGPAALASGLPVAAPLGLSATTVRVGVIYLTSNLAAAPPGVAGITNEVLRMFWVKKMITGVVNVLAALTLCLGIAALGLCLGIGLWGGGPARSEARAAAPLAGDPQPPASPEAAKKALDDKVAELTRKATEIQKLIDEAKAEKAKIEATEKEKASAAKLDGYLDITCRSPGQQPHYIIREVIGGKVRDVSCNDLEMLTTYATRAYNDPKGPKNLNVHFTVANLAKSMGAGVDEVLLACAKAGYKKATVFRPGWNTPFGSMDMNGGMMGMNGLGGGIMGVNGLGGGMMGMNGLGGGITGVNGLGGGNGITGVNGLGGGIMGVNGLGGGTGITGVNGLGGGVMGNGFGGGGMMPYPGVKQSEVDLTKLKK